MNSIKEIDSFLANRKIAIAGMSRNSKKFGNIVHRTLSKKGFELYPIHPEVDIIDGEKCFSSITELPPDVKDLLLVIQPQQSELVVRKIPDSSIERVWMQQGAESEEAIKFCKGNDIPLIHGTCILMHAQPDGIHKFHHWLLGLFGKVPK